MDDERAWTSAPPPAFHAGEVQVQERLGVRSVAARMEPMVTRSTVPPAVTAFLEDQGLIALSWLTADGTRRATLLSGRPGFVTVDDPRSVLIHADDLPGDLSAVGPQSFPLGATAIDLASRRRAKLKGAASLVSGGLRLQTERVYALCPKYIQSRKPLDLAHGRGEGPWRDRLDESMSDVITRADTAFVGTYHPVTGADASHRGGPPGFLSVVDDHTVVWTDYAGNNMFNTIGNLEHDRRAALVVADFRSGALVEMSGEITTTWTPQRRLVHTIIRARRVDGALPATWTTPVRSPHNPPTST